MSPTVLQSGPFRFFFFSTDRGEPQHVHVARDEKAAKIWLEPVRLEYNRGFTQAEIKRIIGLTHEHQEELVRSWHAFFDAGN